MLVDAAQEENAQRLFLPAQLERPGNLVGIFIHVVHHKLVVGFCDPVLNGFHHLAEQLIADALDHHQNGVGMGLLELLGVDVNLEANFLSSLQNGGSGFFADVGMVVQRTGNGADGVAGFGGEVFDCHVGVTSFIRVWLFQL